MKEKIHANVLREDINSKWMPQSTWDALSDSDLQSFVDMGDSKLMESLEKYMKALLIYNASAHVGDVNPDTHAKDAWTRDIFNTLMKLPDMAGKVLEIRKGKA